MIPDTPQTGLDRLLASGSDRSLDGLEDAVWSRLPGPDGQ